MQKTTFIYALCEPGTRMVRYIGKTGNLKCRFRKHLRESVKFDSHLGHWLSLVVSRGERPEMVILREVEGDGSEAEKRYIRLARGCQMRLVNSTDGGDGLSNPSPETRKKIGDAHRAEKNNNFGKCLPIETREKISASTTGENNGFFGHTHSEESKALISAALIGRPGKVGFKHSVVTKARMSDAQSGENNSFFGEKHSEETKSLLRAFRKGKKNTAEQNAAIGAALLGKKRGAYKTKRSLEIEWALAPYTLE